MTPGTPVKVETQKTVNTEREDSREKSISEAKERERKEKLSRSDAQLTRRSEHLNQSRHVTQLM